LFFDESLGLGPHLLHGFTLLLGRVRVFNGVWLRGAVLLALIFYIQ
jgi:hypothetical protein